MHSPDHEAELEDLGDGALAEVLGMWQRRIAAQLDGGAAAVTLIGNLGAGSGASLEHPHEQLFATPIVPPLLLDELARGRALPQPLRDVRPYATQLERAARPARAGRPDRRLGARGQPLQRRAVAGARGARGRLPRRRPCRRWRRRCAACWPRSRRRSAERRSISGCTRRRRTCAARSTGTWSSRRAPRRSRGSSWARDIAIVTKAPEAAAAEYRAALPPA